MTAARTGLVDGLKALLDRGANVNAAEKWHGQTALMWAAGQGHTAVVQELIRRGAALDTRSNGGMTALLFAVRADRIDTVAGAARRRRQRERCHAGRDECSRAGHRQCALRARRASSSRRARTRTRPIRAVLPLHALTWMRNPGYAAAPPRVPTGNLDSLELARALLERGADPNARVKWKEVKFDRDLGMVRPPAEHFDRARIFELCRRDAVLPGREGRRRGADAAAGRAWRRCRASPPSRT